MPEPKQHQMHDSIIFFSRWYNFAFRRRHLGIELAITQLSIHWIPENGMISKAEITKVGDIIIKWLEKKKNLKNERIENIPFEGETNKCSSIIVHYPVGREVEWAYGATSAMTKHQNRPVAFSFIKLTRHIDPIASTQFKLSLKLNWRETHGSCSRSRCPCTSHCPVHTLCHTIYRHFAFENQQKWNIAS